MTEEQLHPVDHRTEPIGEATPPAELEHRVQALMDRIRKLTAIATVLVLAAVTFYLGAVYFRGRDSQRILRTIQVNSSPEAQDAQRAYLEVFRYQIDCDGRYREQESDNALLGVVASTFGGQQPVKFPEVELAKEAESCRKLPEAERKLAEAAKKLQALRDKIG